MRPGWRGIDTTLKLSGWAKARRIVLLRRRVKGEPATDRAAENPNQLRLSFATVTDNGEVWEHAASRHLARREHPRCRPAPALDAIAERIRHARQTTLRIASTHAKAHWAARALAGIAAFLGTLANAAEQLTPEQRWYRILSHALRHFERGRVLKPPTRLAAAAT